MTTERDFEREVLISLSDIQVTYINPKGESFFALSEVNLEVCSGDYLAILGASGSGKTSLSNIIGLLSQNFKGSYRLGAHLVSALNDRKRVQLRSEKFGFIFQDYVLLEHLSALENVEMALRYSSHSRKKIRKMAEAKLSLVGLDGKFNHRPFQLSGGQKQRVAIARALVKDPAILIADEPTGALDGVSRVEILSLLQDLNESGVTIITVTHSAEDALAAKRIIEVEKGKIVADSHQLKRIRYFGKNLDLADSARVGARREAVLEHLDLRFGVRTVEAFLSFASRDLDFAERLLVLEQVDPEWFTNEKLVTQLEVCFEKFGEIEKIIISRKILIAESMGISNPKLLVAAQDLFKAPFSEEGAMFFLQSVEKFPAKRLSKIIRAEFFFKHVSRRVRATAIYLIQITELVSEKNRSDWFQASLTDVDARVRSNTLDYLLESGNTALSSLRAYGFERDPSHRVRAVWAEILVRGGERKEAWVILEKMALSDDRVEILSAIWVMGKERDFQLTRFLREYGDRNPALLAYIDDILKTYSRAKDSSFERSKLVLLSKPSPLADEEVFDRRAA